MDEIRHILVERDILAGSRGGGGWLVQLLYAFQDEESIYLAMVHSHVTLLTQEYVPGGDFRSLINGAGILRNEHARFYSAEMFLAVSALHKLGYIHRDLKPENFLVGANGHIKLTDFGLSSGILAGERIESMRLKLDAVSQSLGDLDAGRRSVKDRRRDYKTLRESNVNYVCSLEAGVRTDIGKIGCWIPRLHGSGGAARISIRPHGRLLVFGMHAV
jgi:cell cycle protein kinase DBF2